MEAVTFDGAKLVGVGRGGCLPDFDNPTDCYGAAWTSADGATWVRAGDQPGLAVGLEVPVSGPEKGIFDVAAGPAGIVAVGHQYAGIGPGIWRSTDGLRWARVTVGSNVVDDFFVAVAAAPNGYVIVGRAVDYRALTARAAAWVSPDGLTWTRVPDAATMDVGPCLDTGEEPSCGGMRAITWTGSTFVAVGDARDDFGKVSRPAAWKSSDGLVWNRIDTGLDFGGHLSDVTVGGPGLVAVGTICQPPCDGVPEGFAATSRDGSTWTVTPIVGSNELGAVASAAGYTFAVGVDPGPAPPASLQVWRSTDGVDWQRLPGPPPFIDATSIHAVDATSSGDRLVIVGWTLGDVGINFAYESPRRRP